jgi:hypothetical protein
MKNSTICQGDGMENRWSDRRDLCLGVDIIQQGKKLATCTSRDVGLGGTYIGVDDDTKQRLHLDADVELVFHLLDDQQETKHTLYARIVRVDTGGIGLKFHEFDTGVFRSLQEIMSYHGVERVH